MKKRIFALLVVLAMLLAGCGGKQTESSVSGKVEPATEPVQATEEVTLPAATEPTEAEEEEPQPEETPVSMGRIDGGTYTNEYTGYGCTMDKSWTFYSAEELQEIPANVKEILEGTEVGDNMQDVAQFTDMMAENVDMLSNVNVLYQRMSMQERLAYQLLSDEEILDETLKQKDTMIAAYAQAGLQVESMERVSINFLGQERAAMRTVADMSGITQYMLQVFDFHIGQYSVVLTATSYMEDNTQWVLDQFYAVD